MTPKPARSSIIVPLYMYPVSSETWAPLHKAIAAHPNLQFTVIVNPNSGPGEPPFPDEDYAREIPRLNAQQNVCTLGYVRTGYCKRSLREVYGEVATYAGWSNEQPESGVFVKGIFLDETPNHYSSHVAGYLDTLGSKIKASAGIKGQRLVIHNPGTMPDEGLTRTGPDITAVFEEGFARFQACSPYEKKALELYNREKCCYIMHSVPSEKIRPMVLEMRHRASFVFATDLHQNYYERFGPSWEAFVEAMDEE